MRHSKFAFTYKSQLTLNTTLNGSYAARYGHWSARPAACVVRNQDFRGVYSACGAAILIPWWDNSEQMRPEPGSEAQQISSKLHIQLFLIFALSWRIGKCHISPESSTTGL
jgi:hypothetical protein